MRSYCNDRDLLQQRLFAHPGGEQESVIVAELKIKQHCVRMHAYNRVKGILDARYSRDLIASSLEPAGEQMPADRAIRYDQDATLHVDAA
jgi:hypothetical protein